MARVIRSLLFWVVLATQSAFNANSATLFHSDKYDLDFNHSKAINQEYYDAFITIKLKDGWRIFAKNKSDITLNPQLELNNSSINIKSVAVKWPDSYKTKGNAYVYEGKVVIPIRAVINSPSPQPTLSFDISFVVCNKVCILEKRSYSVKKELESAHANSNKVDILYMLVIAFIGGFILNLMPCVLPVISLKVLSIIKARDAAPKRIKMHLMATAAGIIACFISIGITIATLKKAGQYAGLGFNFQQPAFITTLAFILIFFACSVGESVNIDIPHKWRQKLLKYSDGSKVFGSFLSGVVATLLATPCTAPFVGTAISFACALGIWEIITIFGAMGTGMSLPFILFAAFPITLKLIPKPGAWLAKFKRMVEIIIYLTVLWLIWIFSKQLGANAAIALFLLCLLFKFVIEISNKSVANFWLKIIFVILILFSAFAILPRVSNIHKHSDEVIKSTWQKFEITKIEKYLRQGKVVIVDVTADWCITCKYNKALILDSAYMIAFSKSHNLVLLRADYTNYDKEIAQFLKSYSRSGIPFNLVLSKKHPQGIILPTILRYSDIINAVKKSEVM